MIGVRPGSAGPPDMKNSSTDDTRQRLLEAAGQIFAERGFQAATIREICRRAGANVAAVNYHFGDKERLYIEAVRYAHCSGMEAPDLTWPDGTPPETKLTDFIRGMLESILHDTRPMWQAQLIIRELIEPSQACVEMVEKFIRGKYEILQAILTELMPEGTEPSDRRLVAFSIVGQCLYYNKIHKPIGELLAGEEEYRSFDLDRLTDHITRFSLAALGRQPFFAQVGDARL